MKIFIFKKNSKL